MSEVLARILTCLDVPIRVAKLISSKRGIPLWQFPLEDMEQEGMLALMKAAAKFEPSHGASFRSWAVERVKHGLLDAIRARVGRHGQFIPLITMASLDDPETGSSSGGPHHTKGMIDMLRSREERPERRAEEADNRELIRRIAGKAYWPIAEAILDDKPAYTASPQLGVCDSQVSLLTKQMLAKFRESSLPRLLS